METQVMYNKTELISKISKDKNSITKLWVKAELNYNLARYSKGDYKTAYKNIMRKAMTEIVGVVLDDYNQEDKIPNTFLDFSDFLNCWLNDVGIDPEMYNKMEDFFHETN